MNVKDLFPDLQTYRDGSTCLQLGLADRYFVDYVSGGQTLVVTFFGRGGVSGSAEHMKVEYPWGYKYLRENGYSLLGVKPVHVDWYRGIELHQFFESGALRNWLSRFDRVIFYGCSMGGYAAVSFSRVVAGAEVIAMSPQTTLCPYRAKWEDRFQDFQYLNWTGSFVDAVDSLQSVKKLWLIYDPFDLMDRRHVSRLRGENTTCLPMAFAGHNTANALQRMNLLKWLFESVACGYLNRSTFHQEMKRRREHPVYFINLSKRIRNKHGRDAALQKADAMISDNPLIAISIADIHLEQEELPAAETLLLRAVGQGGKSVQAKIFYRLSKIYQKRGAYDAARIAMKSASQLQPQNKVYSLWTAELGSEEPGAFLR